MACDLAVMLADGRRESDLAAMAGQKSLFGEVASVSAARRLVLSVGRSERPGMAEAALHAFERLRALLAPG